MNNAHIIGWGHTPFGKLDALDMEQLIRDAALPAVASAGLQLADIDGIFVGHFNGGFVQQDFSGALDRKSTRLNSSHVLRSRMPSSA